MGVRLKRAAQQALAARPMWAADVSEREAASESEVSLLSSELEEESEEEREEESE